MVLSLAAKDKHLFTFTFPFMPQIYVFCASLNIKVKTVG